MKVRRLPAMLLLIFLLLAAALPAARAEDVSFNGYGELLGHLAGSRPEELDFSCPEELYAMLRENDFRELFRLMVRVGIDQDRAAVSYNDAVRFLSLRDLVYTGRPWAECLTLSDVSRALRAHAPSPSDLVLLCADDVLTALTDGGQLPVLTAGNGMESYSYSYSIASGILTLTSPEYFTVPWAAADDYAQFSMAAADFAARGVDDFIIVFDPDLLAKITGSREEMAIMLAGSRILSYNGTYDRNSGVFHYSGVTYTDMPREICRTAGETEDAIRRMGSAGIREFELIFPDLREFEALLADDFALLYEMENRAGMSRSELSFDRTNGRLIFTGAEISADAPVLRNAAEAAALAERLAAEGETDIHLFCTPELYGFLLADGAEGADVPEPLIRIYDLIAQAGIFNYDITTTDAVHVISIHINALFTGTKILRAVRTGDLGSLSEREMMALREASAIAEEAMQASDPLQRAKIIHDRICARTAYTVDETADEDDTAVGVLLRGQANCDGYTDAFYLIGSLAGLNVRRQHGESLDKSSKDMLSSVSHIWNLLEIGGIWHMVDVTWDDEETGWTYIWFNVGRDTAGRMHFWNEDMTVPIAETTQRLALSDREFYVSDEAELAGAVDLAARRHLPDFYIIFERPFPGAEDTARELVGRRITNNVLTWSRNEKMGLLGFHDLVW